MEWISVKDREPSLEEERADKNWKFLVCNDRDKWTDAAYYNSEALDEEKWNNGECDIIPTHWMPLPEPPTN